MNAQRRKEIDKIFKSLEDVLPELEAIQEEEEDARDSMPESLEGSERWEMMEEAINYLMEAYGNVEEDLSNLESAQE